MRPKNRRHQGRQNNRFQLALLERRLLLDAALLSISDHHDLIFDPLRNQLDIPGDNGKVYRYDLASKTMLTPLNVGGTPGQGDITVDGAFLYLTDHDAGAIRKVNLSTGVTTSIPFQNPYDLAIYSATSALVVSNSGLYTFDLTTEVLTRITGSPLEINGTAIFRSADRQTMVANEYYSYAHVIDVSNLTQLKRTTVGMSTALNPDGSLLALAPQGGSTTHVWDRQFAPQTYTLPAGMATFSPIYNTLYIVPDNGNTLLAIDATTFAVKRTYDVGEIYSYDFVPPGPGMTTSADGQTLFFATNQGVRVFEVDESRQVTVTLNAPDSSSPNSVTFTAEISGSTLPGASVRFMDGSKVLKTLPMNGTAITYTTTSLLIGPHDFQAIYIDPLSNAGTPSNTVPSVIYNPAVGWIPITQNASQIVDALRGLLYIPMPNGDIFRYRMATNDFLPAFHVSGYLGNGDITADGQYLYVCDTKELILHKIDLNTGGVHDIYYEAGGEEYGGWDFVIMDNGRGYLDGTHWHAWAYLHPVDLATDIVARSLSPGNPEPAANTNMIRSADRSTFFLTGSDPTFYSSDGTRGAGATWWRDPYVDSRQAAINSDGSLVAISSTLTALFDRDFHLLTTDLPAGAMAFSPVGDRLFIQPKNSKTLNIYDTASYALLTTIDLPESARQTDHHNALTTAYDGQIVFVSSDSGIWRMEVNQDTPPAPTLVSSVSTSSYGQTVTFTATIDDPDGGWWGSFIFKDGNSVLATRPIDPVTQSASFSINFLEPRTHAMTVEFHAGPVKGPASDTLSFNVNKALPAGLITVTSPGIPSRAPTIQIEMTGLGSPPSGEVFIYFDGTIGGRLTIVTGKITYTRSKPLSVGEHSISAFYAGGHYYLPLDLAPITVTVQQLASTVTVSAKADTVPSESVKLTAMVSSGFSTVPGGQVTFYDGDTVLATRTVDKTGEAHIYVPQMSYGFHQISVSYSGSGDFFPSTSTPLPLTVAQFDTTTVLTPAEALVGSRVFLSAHVSTTYPTILPGDVSFYEGSTLLGVASLDSNGNARLPVIFSTAGNHVLTATYNGSTDFNASTATPATVVITSATVIDLLAVYSREEGLFGGAVSQILERIQGQIDDANEVFANSEIPVVIRLVGLSATG